MIDAMTMPTMTPRIHHGQSYFQEQPARPEPAQRSTSSCRSTPLARDLQIVAGLIFSLFCGALASDMLIQFWAR
jgi:hypothetical protein